MPPFSDLWCPRTAALYYKKKRKSNVCSIAAIKQQEKTKNRNRRIISPVPVAMYFSRSFNEQLENEVRALSEQSTEHDVEAMKRLLAVMDAIDPASSVTQIDVKKV